MKNRLLIFSLILAGCSAAISADERKSARYSPTSRPTSRQATTTNASTLRRADALPIDQLYRQFDPGDGSVELTLTDKIVTAEKSALLFGQLDTIDAEKSSPDDSKISATAPVIVWRDVDGSSGGEHGLLIEDNRLQNAAWSYVAVGPAPREIWGVLDASLDDPQRELCLVHSIDAGENWAVSTITKTDRHATFDSFCMAKDGKGRVTIYTSLSSKGRRNKTGNKSAGYDTFHTTDGGKTWSPPTHEPDNMQPADTVDPDSDDQIEPPEPMQKASLDGFKKRVAVNLICFIPPPLHF